MEVYYREGEDEVEEPKVLPTVRAATELEQKVLGEELLAFLPQLCYPSPILITSFSIKQWGIKGSYLSLLSCLRTGSVNTNNMFIKN